MTMKSPIFGFTTHDKGAPMLRCNSDLLVMCAVYNPLYLSLLKWAVIYRYISRRPFLTAFFDAGAKTCALCIHQRFCRACVVYKHTLLAACRETPYEKFNNGGNPTIALDEFEFLGSLIDDTKDWEIFQKELCPSDINAIDMAKSAVRHRTRSY